MGQAEVGLSFRRWESMLVWGPKRKLGEYQYRELKLKRTEDRRAEELRINQRQDGKGEVREILVRRKLLLTGEDSCCSVEGSRCHDQLTTHRVDSFFPSPSPAELIRK